MRTPSSRETIVDISVKYNMKPNETKFKIKNIRRNPNFSQNNIIETKYQKIMSESIKPSLKGHIHSDNMT